MKVRMKTRYANGDRSIEPDQVADLPTAEAKDLIAKGFALPVEDDPSHVPGAAPRKAAPRKAKAETGQNGSGDPADGDSGADEGAGGS